MSSSLIKKKSSSSNLKSAMETHIIRVPRRENRRVPPSKTQSHVICETIIHPEPSHIKYLDVFSVFEIRFTLTLVSHSIAK